MIAMICDDVYDQITMMIMIRITQNSPVSHHLIVAVNCCCAPVHQTIVTNHHLSHRQKHFLISQRHRLTRGLVSPSRCTGSGSPRCRRKGRCKCSRTTLCTCLALSAPEAHSTMKGIQNQPARICHSMSPFSQNSAQKISQLSATCGLAVAREATARSEARVAAIFYFFAQNPWTVKDLCLADLN